MPVSPMRLIKRSVEHILKEEREKLPGKTRGIYVLYDHVGSKRFNVVYIGMAAGEKASVRGRIRSHANSHAKQGKWTHFSVFEVWDNIREEEVVELEGLLRHIYRYDEKANSLNKQKSYSPLRHVDELSLKTLAVSE